LEVVIGIIIIIIVIIIIINIIIAVAVVVVVVVSACIRRYALFAELAFCFCFVSSVVLSYGFHLYFFCFLAVQAGQSAVQ